LTEDGRKLLESGNNAKALTHLEKTLGIDSTNPYVYLYLAKAHFNLAHYRQSVDFLDVAEALLYSQPYWMAEVLSLKGENFQAMGLLKEANHSLIKRRRED
jgi:tetratricopeptide (TPR) repeat protein